LKKRRKRQPAKQTPPIKPGDSSGGNPGDPKQHSGKQEIDSFSELFDEDRLDYLDNLARSPKERRHTDLLAIGLLLLLCAVLMALVIVALHYQRFSGPKKTSQIAWVVSSTNVPQRDCDALSDIVPTSRPSYA
jgi:hypothetical protein